ncbi:MAG: ATP-binding cassette domain-containing protein, partial [Calditrichaeota bacterium]
MKESAALKLAHSSAQATQAKVEISDLHVWFGEAHVLREIELTLREFQVNCIVGPSGSGKSTLIRSINRMNDEVEGYVCKGAIRVNGRNILSRSEN